MALLGCALIASIYLLTPRQETTGKVTDFRLLDSSGQSFQLSQSKSVWVLSPQTDSSKISRFEALSQELQAQAQFFYLHQGYTEEWPSEIPILVDPALVVTEQLGLSFKDEVVAVKPDGQLLYRGRLEGLETALRGGEQSWPEAKGEPLFATELPEFSYSDVVAPIMVQKCLPCHREGQIAPFAFSQYGDVAKRKSMIKEVVLTGRMPPWGVNPNLAKLVHELALSPLEKRALISWIDRGAPIDGPNDPLVDAGDHNTAQKLQNPDLILTPEEFVEVPAEGILDYKFIEFPNTFPHDVYIKGMHFKPGDARAVHHANLLYNDTGEKLHADSLAFLGQDLMGFDPTVYRPMILAEETGVSECGILLPKNSKLVLSLHLSTYGRTSRFKPSIALQLSKEKPQRVVKPVNFLNPEILIPPNTPRHVERASHVLTKKSILRGLFPHMHYRGWAARFEVDGERVLQVPRYDFNWQHAYWLKNERVYPAGTKMELVGTFNNSATNPQNPDPNETVPFGLQSQHEMLYGTLFIEEVGD